MPKLKDGGFSSDHACLIPHIPDATNLNSTNRKSVYVKLADNTIVDVPANFGHYVDPTVHKEYGRFMPNLLFVEWALQPTLNIIDYTSVASDVVKPYGYISYVRKNGSLDCGISDFGRRKGTTFPHPEYAGQLVMTRATDQHVIGKAAVQKPVYVDLCKEVGARFGFQTKLYDLECHLSKVVPILDAAKMDVFQRVAQDFFAKGGSSNAIGAESDRLFKAHPPGSGFQEAQFNLDGQRFTLTEYERLMVVASLFSNYFGCYTLDPVTLTVIFPAPSERVLAQLNQYRAECNSTLGYQSPTFFRTPALPPKPEKTSSEEEENNEAYDSDDEFKGKSCCIM